MADANEITNMALFCDFGNIAVGVRHFLVETVYALIVERGADEKSGQYTIRLTPSE